MASSKAPNNDFAPAWLKIPQPNDNRPSGGKHNDRWHYNRQDDSHGSYSKYVQDYSYGPLPRQRSFESYDDGHRLSPSKQRHHSIDDDYYQQVAYTSYYNGYYGDEKYSNHHRSQPILYRPGSSRDGKYHHPHSRYGQQMNGSGGGYYDYQYDCPSDYYGSYIGRQETEVNGKLRDSRKERRQSGDKSKPQLDDDFPSLNGDTVDGEKSGLQDKVSANSAWENPPRVQENSKPSSRQSSPDAYLRREENNSKNGGSMYKAVVTKSTLTKKIQNRDPPKINGQTKREKKADTYHRRGSPDINSNDKPLHESHNGDGKEDLSSSIEQLKISPPGKDLLSSSLEAEQRLLREMGWKDEDDEEYVITEDDMKEFKNLSEQMKQKNGAVKPSLPKSWSPKHLNSYDILNAEAELNDTLSSDSDSDID